MLNRCFCNSPQARLHCLDGKKCLSARQASNSHVVPRSNLCQIVVLAVAWASSTSDKPPVEPGLGAVTLPPQLLSTISSR